MNTGMKKTARIMTAGLAVCLCLTVALFFLITRQYRHNIAYSSATHLIEINHQGRENIYSLLLKEQELARDIDADIVPGGFSSDEKLMSYLDAKRSIWQQKDIYIYTEDGRCFNTRGEAENEGTAAQLAAANDNELPRQGLCRNFGCLQSQHSGCSVQFAFLFD